VSGPWVAERYVAVRALMQNDAAAMHPVTRGIVAGATRFTAADTFEAMYRLMALRRAAETIWKVIDVLAVPTIPTPYSLDAVIADPIRLNSNLVLDEAPEFLCLDEPMAGQHRG
jgi:allophanate hydrolase